MRRCNPNPEGSPTAKTKKTTKKAPPRYNKDDVRALKAHSKARTPIDNISKQMKRSVPALRAKAHQLGIGR
uniref:Uncharacterized protein n=1 Tax=Bradyrhizobium septentrionale TaxID=1404411 RepID=A0A973W8S2_9BRAD